MGWYLDGSYVTFSPSSQKERLSSATVVTQKPFCYSWLSNRFLLCFRGIWLPSVSEPTTALAPKPANSSPKNLQWLPRPHNLSPPTFGYYTFRSSHFPYCRFAELSVLWESEFFSTPGPLYEVFPFPGQILTIHFSPTSYSTYNHMVNSNSPFMLFINTSLEKLFLIFQNWVRSPCYTYHFRCCACFHSSYL